MLRHTASSSGDGHYSEKVLGLAVLVALLVGVALYNVIPIDHGGDGTSLRPAAAVAERPSASAPVPAPVADAVQRVLAGSSGPGSSFATTVAAIQTGVTTDELLGSSDGSGAVDTPETPAAPSVPTPACPTEQVSDAYDSVARPLGEAIGQSLPADNLRVLTEIAAGCSDATPTTPLIGLALDVARLLPDTGIAPPDLSAIPAIPAPPLPPQVLDALAPLNDQIMEACGNIGLLGVLMAVFPSAAHVPVDGNQLGDVLVPAQTLCAQFER